MFRALLHGKLSREQANMEDLLTSLVFGTLEHQDPQVAVEFLRRARTADGVRPLSNVDAQSIQWKFWPWVNEAGCLGCEPDLVVRFEDGEGQRVCLFIEVKYLSGKSSQANDTSSANENPDGKARDQLARQWQNLAALKDADERWVLYATSHMVFPEKDVQEALEEVERNSLPAARIAWLPLRELQPLLARATSGPLHALMRCLQRLELVSFEGISAPQSRNRLFVYTFGGFDFARAALSPPTLWSFGGFPWPRRGRPVSWGFHRDAQ